MAVDRIVQATLYEGYILYPYRPTSVKNQVRWTFGGVFPRAHSEASGGSEPWVTRTECLLAGDGESVVDVEVRFLQPLTRTVAALPVPSHPGAGLDARALVPVGALEAGGVTHRAWEEAAERSIAVGAHRCSDLLAAPLRRAERIVAGQALEELHDSGAVVGALVRRHEELAVEVAVSVEEVGDGLIRVAVEVANHSGVAGAERDRDRALLRALVSTHAVLGVAGGRWLSLADPPEAAAEAAAGCRNTGLWPVLLGEPGGDDDTILASPIILDDHPEVAPESAGDLFDATEIDEILSLRILTLTDGEKAEMRAADTRARDLLDRTEALTAEQFLRMHGALRPPRPTPGGRR